MAELATLSLKQMRGLKDVPAVRQLALLIGLAMAVAAGVALFSWSQQPNYVPVYPGLAEKDASAVAEALALSWRRTNGEALGRPRCTRADFTGCRLLTVRASSVSSASW